MSRTLRTWIGGSRFAAAAQHHEYMAGHGGSPDRQVPDGEARRTHRHDGSPVEIVGDLREVGDEQPDVVIGRQLGDAAHG